jgi:hypothetical protein
MISQKFQTVREMRVEQAKMQQRIDQLENSDVLVQEGVKLDLPTFLV